ncbi:MAG TPA: glycosyltransferase family A protein [Blastocatellia bacterium]|jgi:glycosyltransferase involved in cell wall biosynthesis|nr:glycosyltransferase family A protein [Blastocatellia bacterium]
MNRLTIAIPYTEDEQFETLARQLIAHQLVEEVLCLHQNAPPSLHPSLLKNVRAVKVDAFFSGLAINSLIEAWRTDYLLLILPEGWVELGARALERFVQVADDAGAAFVYSDFRQQNGADVADHPLIDYQLGSIRDNFDFGSAILLSREEVGKALRDYGGISPDIRWGGLYDLRLKLSINSTIFRIPEPLYTRVAADLRASGEKIFDYVDPRKRDYQIEMEKIATQCLERIGARLEPSFANPPESREEFPVKASVVIPVRNRVKTIADAVRSALTQKTDFPFNVIVVDNHSTDGTTDLLRKLAADSENLGGEGRQNKLIHIVPARTDYGIGGCWNEAIYSPHCGRYAVQLDSDDVYSSENTLARIVAEFDSANAENKSYAMVIGSYTIVDFELNELPPGLIDHREWTRENGRNNALRINGLGAPRAFDVTVLRRIGLPNTSYGEDYAVALRISREYEVGRIYDSLYFARRWSDNSDSALPLATMNRYDAYKDRLRTIEILARRRFNARKRVKGAKQ